MSTAYADVADALWKPNIRVPLLSMFLKASETPEGTSNESQVIIRHLLAAQRDFAFPVTRQGIEIAERFDELMGQWREESLLCSSATAIISSPAYRQIVEMGWQAVPFIIDELRKKPDHWYSALREITGEDPVAPKHQGNLVLMAKDWLKWARERQIPW